MFDLSAQSDLGASRYSRVPNKRGDQIIVLVDFFGRNNKRGAWNKRGAGTFWIIQ